MNKSFKLPNFHNTQQALEQLDIEHHPSEVHGLLCAMFSTVVTMKREAWLDSLLTQKINQKDAKIVEARTTLLTVFDTTKKMFTQQDEEEIQLLLPEDAGIADRIEALALWSQGFIIGLNLVNVNVESNHLSSETREALEDLTKMSCLSHDAEEDGDEEADHAYAELVEYARVGAMLVFEDCLNARVEQQSASHQNATQH